MRPPDGLRMKLVTGSSGAEGGSPQPHPLTIGEGERGAGDETIKTLDEIWRAGCRHRGAPCLERAGKLCTSPHPYLAMSIFSIWLFLSCTLCNKPVNLSRVFSRVL